MKHLPFKAYHMQLNRTAFLFLFAIIIMEGYVVLSSELLAIRVMIPFVGSGTDTVSIIIAAVLLPLSFGYYAGGHFRPYRDFRGKLVGVREKLTRNIITSAAILVIGLSYAPLNTLMVAMIEAGMTNRLVLTSIYSLLFLVTPVYLLGQTIPLISHYFTKEKLSQITGKILFVSTIGSFLGATFSTLVLMGTVGVHYTASFNFLILAVLFFMLATRKGMFAKGAMAGIVLLGLFFNSDRLLQSMHVVANNRYNVVQLFESADGTRRILLLNHNSDSAINANSDKHPYINFIESNFIYSVPSDAEPIKVLVLGAGGFTLGLDDTYNTYHFVDIDGELKEISEKLFLKKELEPNKIFHPISAESFLIQGSEKYDLIVLDAYQGALTIPENLITQDFFRRVKNRLSDNGIVVSNFIVNPSFGDAFSRNLDTTFRSVFPHITKHVIGQYNAWNTKETRNVIYVYHRHTDEIEAKETIYTDNRNTSYYDRPKSKYVPE